MFGTLFSFSVATFVLSISPGPDNIFVLTQSIVNGRKFGLAIVFGLLFGCLIHTSLVVFGVSVFVKENESIFLRIKIFGASYLLYLAAKVYQTNANIVLSNNTIRSQSVF